MSLVRWIERQWMQRSGHSVWLAPLAWLYGIAVALRRAAYRHGLLKSTRLGLPVLVIGNFTVGGTGKTPLTIRLVEALRDHGWTPGVVSRGYGSSGTGARAVELDGDWRRFGDEPCLIAARTRAPVWVDADRANAGRALRTAHPEVDVIVCDDGLQHLALARDFEIAVFDARGAGNGRLLPAGPLRERPRSVDAVVRNGGPAASAEFAMQLAPAYFYPVADAAKRLGVDTLKSKRLHAVAGIGAPERFFATLEALGLAFEPHAFPDHHVFQSQDLAFADCDVVLMTEKDAVKCRSFHRSDLVALTVDAQIDEALVARIIERLAVCAPRRR